MGRVVLFFSLCAFIFSACNNIAEKKEQRTDTLNYTIYKAESSSAFKRMESDTVGTYAIITYPNFTQGGDTASINKLITYELTKEFKGNDIVVGITDAAAAFVMKYDSIPKEIKSNSAYWNRQINVRVPYQQYPYVSLSIEFTEYTGGAHGMYGTNYLNFDREKNKVIGLHDLFDDAKIAEITKQAEQIFRTQEGLTEGQDYNGYFFENGKFVLPANFSIRKGGILFQYGLYEIKPYVAGITEVFVPVESL
jgi:Protein of unknown function (DUF3298)/Deacetylase PdaC